MTAGLSGGEKMMAKLAEIAAKTDGNPEVRVGFIENTPYPDGMNTATVAAIQEWGARIAMPARTQSIFRKVSKSGAFLNNGRFVKRKISNFETSHAVGAHSINIPPRPFFRRMIAEKKKEWGPGTGEALVKFDYDIARTLDAVGDAIAGQLRQSIVDLTDPPLAKSTIARKSRGTVKKIAGVLGPAKPLVETGDMLNSISHQVVI